MNAQMSAAERLEQTRGREPQYRAAVETARQKLAEHDRVIAERLAATVTGLAGYSDASRADDRRVKTELAVLLTEAEGELAAYVKAVVELQLDVAREECAGLEADVEDRKSLIDAAFPRFLSAWQEVCGALKDIETAIYDIENLTRKREAINGRLSLHLPGFGAGIDGWGFRIEAFQEALQEQSQTVNGRMMLDAARTATFTPNPRRLHNVAGTL